MSVQKWQRRGRGSSDGAYILFVPPRAGRGRPRKEEEWVTRETERSFGARKTERGDAALETVIQSGDRGKKNSVDILWDRIEISDRNGEHGLISLIHIGSKEKDRYKR